MGYKQITKILITIGFLACFLLAVTACSIIGSGSGEPTATPMPTSSVADMQVVAPQACAVIEQRMIQVEQPHGDLIAWSPISDTVAYVASTQSTIWNVGELDILSASAFDTPVRLASSVAGELTWAADASSIAYLGLRRSDNLYTIGLAYPDGSVARDLFPGEAARTDDYASQKAILGWAGTNQLSLLISCGLNCMQTIKLGVMTGVSTLQGDPIGKPRNMWAVHNHRPAVIPDEFSKLTGQLNWSPDEKRIAYIDDRNNAWIIDPTTRTLYPLDIGQYGSATEIDWSYDSRYLAVQVDKTLMIFAFNCQ